MEKHRTKTEVENQWLYNNRISDFRLWNWLLVHWEKDTRNATYLIIIISLKYPRPFKLGYHNLFLYFLLTYLLVQHDVSCLSLFYQWSGPPPMFEVVQLPPPPSTTQTPWRTLFMIQTESAGSIRSLCPWPDCNCMFAWFKTGAQFDFGSEAGNISRSLAPRKCALLFCLLSPTINIILSVSAVQRRIILQCV